MEILTASFPAVMCPCISAAQVLTRSPKAAPQLPVFFDRTRLGSTKGRLRQSPHRASRQARRLPLQGHPRFLGSRSLCRDLISPAARLRFDRQRAVRTVFHWRSAALRHQRQRFRSTPLSTLQFLSTLRFRVRNDRPEGDRALVAIVAGSVG
jgi:hypothetical protein